MTIYSLYFHVNVFISFMNFFHKKIDYMFRDKSSSRLTKILFPLLLGRSIFFSTSSSPSSYVTQCHGYYVFTYQNAFTQYTDVFRLRMLKYGFGRPESASWRSGRPEPKAWPSLLSDLTPPKTSRPKAGCGQQYPYPAQKFLWASLWTKQGSRPKGDEVL